MNDGRGFTLVELLVAMAMSAVVIMGATTLIISSLDVTGQVTGRMATLTEGRNGVERLLTELDSGCLAPGQSPVLASTTAPISPTVQTDGTHLVFLSGLDVTDSADPTPTEHVVSVSSTGALLDAAYIPTQSAGGWTYPRTPSQVLNLGEHIVSGTPLFHYFTYPTTAPYSLKNGVELTSFPLTAADAQQVAEVDLDIRFAPSATVADAPDPAGVTSELQDSAVFGLTANGADGAASARPNPCQ